MDKYHRVLALDLGSRVRKVLLTLNAIKADTHVFVWPRDERVVCLVDPLGVVHMDQLLSKRAHHHIQTACQGRRVVFTNHRCAAIQIAYFPELVQELKAIQLDWSLQASPHHLPIGMTTGGPLWLPLAEMDSVLIGGARRMGKTRLVHSWIEALLRGKQAQLFLWDGKNGLEFQRYQNREMAVVATDIKSVLQPILDEVMRREMLFKSLRVASLKEHNAGSHAPLPLLVPVIDEAAFVPHEAEVLLVDLVARCGAYGVHPIIATQRPDAEIMNSLLRANLSTRIALPVASLGDSRVILNQPGAERLLKQPGRLLLAWHARLIEAQAFQVELDQQLPSAATPASVVTHLNRDECRLVEIAVTQCDGFFKIKDLSEVSGLGRDYVLDLAQRWELTGWLTSIQTNAKGHRIGRSVTPKLLEMAGIQPSPSGDLGELGNLEN